MLSSESGITEKVISDRGYCTITDPNELKVLGFGEIQLRVPALAIPVHNVHHRKVFTRIRPDDPRPDSKRRGKVVKYEQPFSTPAVLDVPLGAHEALQDVDVPLWIVEGEKKADALVSRGECAIALLGVTMWQRSGKPLPDWDHIPMVGREVYIGFDSDYREKIDVRRQMARLARYLDARGAV